MYPGTALTKMCLTRWLASVILILLLNSNSFAQREYYSTIWAADIPLEIVNDFGPNDTIYLKSMIEGRDKTTELFDLNGRELDYTYFQKDKVYLLDFWFLACGPCIAEIEGLDRLARAHPKKEFEILSFARDSRSAIFKKKPDSKNYKFRIIPNAQLLKEVKYPHKILITNSDMVYASSQGSNEADASLRVYKKYKAILKQYIK